MFIIQCPDLCSITSPFTPIKCQVLTLLFHNNQIIRAMFLTENMYIMSLSNLTFLNCPFASWQFSQTKYFYYCFVDTESGD